MNINYFISEEGEKLFASSIEHSYPVSMMTVDGLDLVQLIKNYVMTDNLSNSDIIAAAKRECPAAMDKDIIMAFMAAIHTLFSIPHQEGKSNDSIEDNMKIADKILDNINLFIAIIQNDDSVRYSSYDALLDDYDTWSASVSRRSDDDSKTYNRIKDIASELKQLDDLAIVTPSIKPKASKLKEESVVLRFKPLIRDAPSIPIDIENGMMIFDGMIVTANVPYIQYNKSNDEELLRIKQVDTEEYHIIIPHEVELKKRGIIYIQLWLGNIEESQDIIYTRESLYLARYVIAENYLYVSVPIRKNVDIKSIAIKKLNEAIPNLILGHPDEINVTATFSIEYIPINDIILADIIFRDPLMSMFNIREAKEPFCMKKRFDIFFSPILESMYNIKMNIPQVTKKFTLSIPRSTTSYDTSNEENNPIRITITEAPSWNDVHTLFYVIPYLLARYNQKKDEIIAIYESIIPDIKSYGSSHLQRTKKKKKTTDAVVMIRELNNNPHGPRTVNQTRYSKLKEIAPDLFIPGYPGLVKSRQQPIIVKLEDIKPWSSGAFTDGVIREIMKYKLKNGKELYLVFPDPDYRYPGAIINVLSNRDIYPYLPSGQTTQQDTESLGKPTFYTMFLKGLQPPLIQGRNAGGITTSRDGLAPGRLGKVPYAVNALLKRSMNASEYIRIGVDSSPNNSILHSICIALEDPSYIQIMCASKTTADERSRLKEEYVIALRKRIANITLPTLLRQEMYDYTEEQISEALHDPSVYLDPSYFYRALEEAFNINIFVFAPPKNTKSYHLGVMVMPRYYKFPARFFNRDRNSVLIHLTYGTDNQHLQHPQCELISAYSNLSKLAIMLFGLTITNECINLSKQSMRTTTWEVEEGSITTSINKYYRDTRLTTKDIKSQFIDSNGKVRAFVHDGIVMIVPPTPPLNVVSVTSYVPPTYSTLINAINRSSITAIALNIQHEVVAVFISNIEFPIIPERIPNLMNNPIKNATTLFSNQISYLNEYQLAKRELKVLLQLVDWLFDLYKNNYYYQFVNDHIIVSNININYSDLLVINIYTPNVTSVLDAINYLSVKVSSTIFSNGKLLVHNDAMKKRIEYHVRCRAMSRIHGSTKNIRLITNIESYNDLKIPPETFLFNSRRSLEEWLVTTITDRDYYTNFKIYKVILEDFINYNKAYLIDINNHKYIIQNTVFSTLRSAINIHYQWNKTRINYANSSPYADIPQYYNLYNISTSLQPKLFYSNVPEGYIGADVLCYTASDDPNAIFPAAAMLKLD